MFWRASLTSSTVAARKPIGRPARKRLAVVSKLRRLCADVSDPSHDNSSCSSDSARVARIISIGLGGAGKCLAIVVFVVQLYADYTPNRRSRARLRLVPLMFAKDPLGCRRN